MDRVSTGPVRRFPLTKTRTQSPGEIEASSPEPERQADGVRYPLEAHVKRFATRWPKVVKNHGIPFSEGKLQSQWVQMRSVQLTRCNVKNELYGMGWRMMVM